MSLPFALTCLFTKIWYTPSTQRSLLGCTWPCVAIVRWSQGITWMRRSKVLISSTISCSKLYQIPLMDECMCLLSCSSEIPEKLCRNYVDRATAIRNGLVSASSDTFILRSDSTKVLSPSGPGRDSVRLRSNRRFGHGVMG